MAAEAAFEETLTLRLVVARQTAGVVAPKQAAATVAAAAAVVTALKNRIWECYHLFTISVCIRKHVIRATTQLLSLHESGRFPR